MKTLAALTALTALILFFAQPGFPQGNREEFEALKKEVEALKGAFKSHQATHEGQTTILKELQKIKDLLQAGQAGQAPRAAPAQEIVLSVDGRPFKGEKNAKVTLIEFADYQCPFCARHARETLPQIEAEHIKTGNVKYVFRDFPIESIHPQALKAAEAAHCAGEQGKYWEMHGRLFADQRALGLKDLPQHAQALALDARNFQECLDSGKYAANLRRDLADAQKAEVTGTPTFFLGLTEPNSSQVRVLRRLVGAMPYAAFKEAIDGLLSSEK